MATIRGLEIHAGISGYRLRGPFCRISFCIRTVKTLRPTLTVGSSAAASTTRKVRCIHPSEDFAIQLDCGFLSAFTERNSRSPEVWRHRDPT